MRRILFPVDFSRRAANTAALVRAVAARFPAEVHLLHVLSYTPESYGALEYVGQSLDVIPPEALARWRDEKLVKLGGYMPQLWDGVRVVRAVETGEVASEIVEYCRAHQVDLVMMPTHGYGPFRRMLLGSVTSKVLHDAPCPVWTDAHAEDPLAWRPETLERVLCAVDLEDDAACVRVIQQAIAFARPYGAKITVFHAMPQAAHRPGEPDIPGEIVNVARAKLAELAQSAGIGPAVHVEGGWPVEALKRYAGERPGQRPDLLVIGRGKHRGLGRLGSHAYAMIREAPCPVLSI